MAVVEPIAFGPCAVTAITRRTGQSSAPGIGCATASRPSLRSPRAISTKPPKIDRATDPEPGRASPETSAGDTASPAACDAATASAANPDAEEAKPAAVGTLFSV